MRIDQNLFRVLGLEPTRLIYPGHPIVIAFCIIHAFDNYAAAIEKDSHDCPKAVSDSRIPGAGGCCFSALDFLTDLHKGVALDQAIAAADDTWDRIDNHKEGGGIYAKTEADREQFLKRWKDGQAQADLVKPYLKAFASWWA